MKGFNGKVDNVKIVNKTLLMTMCKILLEINKMQLASHISLVNHFSRFDPKFIASLELHLTDKDN